MELIEFISESYVLMFDTSYRMRLLRELAHTTTREAERLGEIVSISHSISNDVATVLVAFRPKTQGENI